MGIFTPNESLVFPGATTRGAAFGPWTQTENTPDPYLECNGSGVIVVDTPNQPPCYLMKASTLYEGAWEVDTAPVSGTATANNAWEVTGRSPSPFAATASGGIVFNVGGQMNVGYTVRWQGNNTLAIWQGNTLLASAAAGTVGVDGHSYRVRIELITGSLGHTAITGRLYDIAAPTVQLGIVTFTDATVALNDPVGTYVEGTASQGLFSSDLNGSGAGWGYVAFRSYAYTAQLPPAVIATSVLNASGTTVSVGITSAGAPMQTVAGARPTGFTVQSRPNSGAAWVSSTILSSSLIGNTATLLLRDAIPSGYLVQVLYSGGNVEDTLSAPPVPMASNAGFAATNSSTYVHSVLTWPYRAIVSATRGNAKVSRSLTYSGVEGQTMFRVEVPYGLAPGWQIAYSGFNYGEGETDSISILGAAYWLAPDDPQYQFPVAALTFDSGSPTTSVAHDAIKYTDPVSQEIRPGSIMWVTVWYRCANPATKMPTMEPWVFVPNLIASGTEDRDGLLGGAYGTLTSAPLLSGGFDHSGNPFPIGAGLAEGYHHSWIKGKPADDFRGHWASPLFVGNSIDRGYTDTGTDNTYLSVRGYFGRRCGFTVPYVVAAKSGAGSGNFTGDTGSAWFAEILGGTPPLVTVGLNEYGINDVRTRVPPSDIAAYLTGLRAAVAAIFTAHGLSTIQSTLSPCIQANTLPYNNTDFATFVAQRGVFNDAVRASVAGSFYDWCSVLEDPASSNSDVWVTANNEDGIHPSTLGHIAAADASIIPIPLNYYNPMPPPPGPGTGSGAGEFGATSTSVPAVSGQVILGPWQTTDREQMRIEVYARGSTDFHLNYEFSTDKGTTWYVGQQVASSSVSTDDGANFPKEASIHPDVGYWWRISVFNVDTVNPLSIAFEWRFHAY